MESIFVRSRPSSGLRPLIGWRALEMKSQKSFMSPSMGISRGVHAEFGACCTECASFASRARDRGPKSWIALKRFGSDSCTNGPGGSSSRLCRLPQSRPARRRIRTASSDSWRFRKTSLDREVQAERNPLALGRRSDRIRGAGPQPTGPSLFSAESSVQASTN